MSSPRRCRSRCGLTAWEHAEISELVRKQTALAHLRDTESERLLLSERVDEIRAFARRRATDPYFVAFVGKVPEWAGLA